MNGIKVYRISVKYDCLNSVNFGYCLHMLTEVKMNDHPLKIMFHVVP